MAPLESCIGLLPASRRTRSAIRTSSSQRPLPAATRRIPHRLGVPANRPGEGLLASDAHTRRAPGRRQHDRTCRSPTSEAWASGIQSTQLRDAFLLCQTAFANPGRPPPRRGSIAVLADQAKPCVAHGPFQAVSRGWPASSRAVVKDNLCERGQVSEVGLLGLIPGQAWARAQNMHNVPIALPTPARKGVTGVEAGM